jgi:pyruvate dehydrogenase E1 component alpha subunit
MADPEFYRNKDEVEHWRSLDPIASFTSALLGQGILTQADVDEIANRVEGEVAKAVEFAESSPDPELSTLFDHVYAGPDAPVDGWTARKDAGGGA